MDMKISDSNFWLLSSSSLLFFLSISFGAILPSPLILLLFFISLIISLKYFINLFLYELLDCKRYFKLIYICGFLVCVSSICGVGIAQVIYSDPTLFWNVDHKYFSTLAWNAYRFPDSFNSIDYLGSAIAYEPSIAWLGASWTRLTDQNFNIILFIVFPFFSVIVIYAMLYTIFRNLGFSKDLSMFIVAVGSNVPTSFNTLLYSIYIMFIKGEVPIVVFNHTDYFFHVSTMLNSLAGFVVGFIILAVIVKYNNTSPSPSPSFPLGLFYIGILSLLFIKPQYAVGFSVLASFLLIKSYYIIFQNYGLGRCFYLSIFLSFFSLVSILFIFGFHEGLSIIGDVGLGFYLNERDFMKGDGWIYVCVLGSLIFGLRLGLLRLINHQCLVGILGAGFFLFLFFSIIDIRSSPELLLNSSLLGFPGDWVFFDVYQSMVPIRIVLIMVLVAFGALVFESVLSPWKLTSFTLCVMGLLVISPRVFQILLPIVDPLGPLAYEASSELDLYRLLNEVELADEVVLLGDLSDSSNNFGRPLLALSVTSVSSTRFYVANVRYGHLLEADAVKRVGELKRFFGAAWSGWHEGFLDRTGARYVLLSNRCQPKWDFADFPGFELGSRGRWTVLEYDKVGFGVRDVEDLEAFVSPQEITPAYGRSKCF